MRTLNICTGLAYTWIAACLAIALGCGPLYLPPEPTAKPEPVPLTDAARAGLALDATVFVGVPGGHGSGFAIDDHTIVTAAHVVEDGFVLDVATRDRQSCEILDIQLHPYDEDVATITVSGCTLRPLQIRCDELQIGESVYLAGHPRMRGWTLTAGIVAALDVFPGRVTTTAVGLPGMSGGPAVDVDGQIVGVAVSILPASGRAGTVWGGQTHLVPVSGFQRFIGACG